MSNSSLPCAVDPGADDVGGHQVGSELDAGERAADHFGEGLDGQGLGHARHTFEQHVALGEQADQHPLDQLVLADDDPLDLEDGALEGVDLLLQASVVRRRGVGAGTGVTGVIALGRGLSGISSSALRRPTR